MLADTLNVHLRATEQEYRAILAEARKLGVDVKVQGDSNGPLYAKLEVTLFVSPNARHYRSAQINDRTYSRTLFHAEQSTKEG